MAVARGIEFQYSVVQVFQMKEITKFREWEELLDLEEFVIFVSKSSCNSCDIVEEDMRNLKFRNVFKISLDNPESFNLRKEISWIRHKVEILPFFAFISHGCIEKKFQGFEFKKALEFLHSRR